MLNRMRCRALLLVSIVTVTGLLSGCTALSFAAANVPTVAGGFVRHGAITYAAGPRGKLDVYVPRNASHAPVVVFWYGGSWQNGHRLSYRFVGAALAEAGYVAILPDYRLYPEVRFPDFNDDAAQAVVWAHQHAAEYGGDARKLFLMGHSAGAHIAASVALDGRYLRRAGGDPAWIAGLIGLSGPYVLRPNTRELNIIFSAPYTAADWQLLNFVSPASPPALLVHGGGDKLVDARNSAALSQALHAAGVAATVTIVPGGSHGDPVAAFAALGRKRAPSLEQTRAFIDARSRELDNAMRGR